MIGPIVTRDDVVKACWRLTGWKADQTAVDQLMRVIDRYVASLHPTQCDASGHIPCCIPELPAIIPGYTEAEVQQRVMIAYDTGFARAKGYERPSDGLTPVAGAITPGAPSRAVSGGTAAAGGVDPRNLVRPCRTCKILKPITAFPFISQRTGGRRTQCEECSARVRAERRQKGAS